MIRDQRLQWLVKVHAEAHSIQIEEQESYPWKTLQSTNENSKEEQTETETSTDNTTSHNIQQWILLN